MKNIFSIKHNLTCLIAFFLGLSMVSCVDNNESDPPVKPFVAGSQITIAQLKSKYDDELAKTDYKLRVPVEITEDQSVKGIITTDDNLNGNLYKEAYIEDATSGILIKINTTGALSMGDSVIVNLKGLYIGDYGSFLQLGSTPYTDNSGNLRVSNVDVDECMSRFSFLNETKPTEVALPALKANLNNYLGRLVIIKDVQFADSELENTYAVAESEGTEADYGNRKLEDCYKNNIIVRSSGYSTFASNLLPQGNGSIVGIVTKYNTTIQLIIRDINEVKMDGARCSGSNNGTPSGSGTKTDPYNVAHVIEGTIGDPFIWVKGYIVGSASGAAFDAGLKLEAPFVGASNIAIADKADETNPALMIPIQLTAGSVVRTAVNLVDNAGNHKQMVYVRGKLQTYFGKNGIRETNGYWWPDSNTGVDPDDTTDPGTGSAIFEETFATGIGNFKTFSIKGDQAWQHDATNKYMKMSGFAANVSYENEDWLVSPDINLTGINNAALEFEHTGKVFGAPFTDMTVWVSTNFDGSNVATASWTQVAITTYMTGNDWVFVKSGSISLADFNNQPKISVAFKYLSSSTASATWEVKNMKVTK